MGILVGPRSSVDSSQPHDVVIESNIIKDYKMWTSSPGPYTPIWIGAQSESWSTDVHNITVQGNSLYLVEPGASSASDGTGPGIWMIRANGGHVIRNNNIYFTGTLTVHGRDGVNSTPNFTFVETITDSDIHDNYIEGATDDGISTTSSGLWSLDLGIPMLVVNHATAELPGMMEMVSYIEQHFPGLPVKYLPGEFPCPVVK